MKDHYIKVQMNHLWKEPLENHSVVVGFFSQRCVVWEDVLSILHHLISHL